MEVLAFGSIKRVVLPGDWIAETERNTQIMTIRTCHPRSHNDVEINFFRRRQELMAEPMQCLREVLSKPPHRITEGSDELKSLAPAMGNAGNNQWTNRAKGQSFRLSNAETLQLKTKLALAVKGTFVDPDTKKAVNEYCGIFLDAAKDKNLVEEVFLQVPSQYGYFQFERYLKMFNELLSSIEWS